jgi:hypothetical protein
MNISVHIERLVLDVLPITPAQRPLLQRAVETDLAHLLGAEGLSPALQVGGALPSLRAGSIQPAHEANPVQLGQQIARAVFGGIGHE